MLVRKDIRNVIKKHEPEKLSREDIKKIKKFYKERGYKNINTDWHQFYIASNKTFSEKYISEDIFHPIISNAVNNMQQWPSLLDKNLLSTFFNEYKQPISIVKNINGFYYANDRQVSKKEAVELCCNYKKPMVIKPSIESGSGIKVLKFSIDNGIINYNNTKIEDLLSSYKKDFIIQKIVSQHPKLKLLNESSLNTLRIMTYLKEKEVHVLSTILRIGKTGRFTDNSCFGGIVVGVNDDEYLYEYGYLASGKRTDKTDSGISLKGKHIPSYLNALKMAKEMHFKIPYFKIVSWDIGIDDTEEPLLIEYNTYRQGIRIHQLVNGPLFGDFTDELLEIGKNHKF